MAITAPRLLAELRGAPDDIIGTPDAKSKAIQEMSIEMDAAMYEQLRACSRRKAAHIVFGRTPVCVSPLPASR
jgi:hypothetical protein